MRLAAKAGIEPLSFRMQMMTISETWPLPDRVGRDGPEWDGGLDRSGRGESPVTACAAGYIGGHRPAAEPGGQWSWKDSPHFRNVDIGRIIHPDIARQQFERRHRVSTGDGGWAAPTRFPKKGAANGKNGSAICPCRGWLKFRQIQIGIYQKRGKNGGAPPGQVGYEELVFRRSLLLLPRFILSNRPPIPALPLFGKYHEIIA